MATIFSALVDIAEATHVAEGDLPPDEPAVAELEASTGGGSAEDPASS